MTKKSIYFGVFILFIAGIISCEKDFQDIGSSVINNTKFKTKDTILSVVVTNKEITNVRADGIALGGALGQYLLGVYNNPNYEKIEASIVSQLLMVNGLKVSDSAASTYGDHVTLVTKIDTAFLKLPYQATAKDANSATAEYVLDSIIGDRTKAFNLNIYQSGTYLNKLNPADPSKAYSYQSDFVYQKLGGELNATKDFKFIPNPADTAIIIKRRLSNGEIYLRDTVSFASKIPFARIPLDEDKMKALFLDKYESTEFASQEAFNQYFKGLYIEASGNEGSLISFNINNSNQELRPSIEIHFTTTAVKDDGVNPPEVLDTILKTNSFALANFSNSIYKMNHKTYPVDKNIVVQGAAGSMAEVKIFGEDANNNKISDQLEALRGKNWLINDASLTFYVNQDIVQHDTIGTPFRLYLFKINENSSPSQITDIFTEGQFTFGGNLNIVDGKPDSYTFRITDYVSDFINEGLSYNPKLGLKVFNNTDAPANVLDTIIDPYSWNPKAVTLLNHLSTNGARKARLKISYTIKE